MKFIKPALVVILTILVALAANYAFRHFRQERLLQQVIQRLTAESRVAEALVTETKKDAQTGQTLTTIKFVEYDTDQKPLPPRYFTFSGNIIQFQSLVIRFDDYYVKQGDPLQGKSAYLFLKAFALNDQDAEVFEITKVNEIPTGYAVDGPASEFEEQLWRRFWNYALDTENAHTLGVKNAQIEAPGTRFIPGMLYTLKIEHDGGLRIDARPLPQILKGERIEF